MNNTSKGLPATCYHQAKHKTTKNQRRANRTKAERAWAANQVGVGLLKKLARNAKRQPKSDAKE